MKDRNSEKLLHYEAMITAVNSFLCFCPPGEKSQIIFCTGLKGPKWDSDSCHCTIPLSKTSFMDTPPSHVCNTSLFSHLTA